MAREVRARGDPAPAAGEALVATLKIALAHVLIDRAGPALQPGTRAYARSWIRDGALISDALLHGRAGRCARSPTGSPRTCFRERQGAVLRGRAGRRPGARERQPRRVIISVDEYYRYTHDKASLADDVAGRCAHRGLHGFLRVQRTSDCDGPDVRGPLPPSISHEGYARTSLPVVLGRLLAIRVIAARRTSRRRSGGARRLPFAKIATDSSASARSIAAMAAQHVDYFPGSADRGDFDPTSTTIALSPAQPGGAFRRLARGHLRSLLAPVPGSGICPLF